MEVSGQSHVPQRLEPPGNHWIGRAGPTDALQEKTSLLSLPEIELSIQLGSNIGLAYVM
jgi:hypothetical protein